jgi:hypothetical protein
VVSRFAVAKDQVVGALDSIVPELFGGGRQQSRRYPSRWAVTNKWRPGAGLDQMSVWRDGGRKGAWRDYVSGEKGDAIDLVAYGLTGIVTADSRMTALEWIEDRFGLKAMSQEQKRELEAKAKERAAALEAADKKRAGSDRRRAQKFFFSCAPSIAGTAAEVYLRSRGIVLEAVPNLSTAFRFKQHCGYWMGTARDGEGNKLGADATFPALVSAMVSGDGHLCACHYTFLEPDGSSKLKTRSRGYFDPDSGKAHSAKLMYPASGGLSIPVTYGDSGLMVRDAAAAGRTGWMGITEGIEDALSVAVSNGELRMHAAGSLGHLGQISDCAAARGYLVFRDNDWGKPGAVAAFDAAIARLKGFGKPVNVIAMPKEWGKDVNDALNHPG